MQLDIGTLLVINAANLLLTATALPFIMGRKLSAAAANARTSLIVQAGGWIAIVLSHMWIGQWQDRLLSTLSIACSSLGQWLMFKAMQGWLGPRRGGLLLAIVVVITPIGYALSFSSYPFRVGWSNGMLALQLLLLCQSTLAPQSTLGGAWRWVVLGCTGVMAFFTAGRGILGAFYTELYPSFRTPNPFNVMAMLAANVTMSLGNVAILVAWREEAERLLREQALTDSMTGLLNRHGWQARAPAVMEEARRYQTPLALVLLDLDHFKRINDTQGHGMGDKVLQMVGQVIQDNLRTCDLAARLGGEEFALLLPQTDRHAALHMEQRLRLALHEACIRQPDLRVNYSAGLAMWCSADRRLSDLLARADAALYRAKSQGRGHLQLAD